MSHSTVTHRQLDRAVLLPEPRRHAPTRPRRRHVRPSELPREYRITQVFRTRGRGLVAEYDPS